MDTKHICSIIALALLGLMLVTSLTKSKNASMINLLLLIGASATLAICNICCHESYDSSDGKTLQVVVMDGCSYCSKLKKEVIPSLQKICNVKVIDNKSPEGKELSKKHNMSGFPSAVMNGKVISGYKPADQYIQMYIVQGPGL